MRKFNSINERLVFASENKTNQVLDSLKQIKWESRMKQSNIIVRNLLKILLLNKKRFYIKKIFNAYKSIYCNFINTSSSIFIY